MKVLRKGNSILLILLLLLSLFSTPAEAKSTKRMSISSKKITLEVGQSKKLKIKGTKKKVKWSSSKKKIATVSSKGVVKAKKKGTCKITAKVAGKKFTCTVKVTNVKKVPQDTTTEEVKDNTPNQPNVPSEPSNPTPTPDKPSDTVTPSQPSVDTREPWQICLEEGKHVYSETVTPATCVSSAIVNKKCTRCGITQTYVQEGSVALGHDMVVKSTTEATCTKGSYETRECTRCHKEETVQVSTSLHHSYSVVEKVEADCVTKSYQKQVCKRCGDVKELTGSNNPNNHHGVSIKLEWCPEVQVDDRHLATEGWGSIAHKDTYYCTGCGEWINSILSPPDSEYKISGEEYLKIIDSCSSISDEAKQLSHSRYNYYLQHNK